MTTVTAIRRGPGRAGAIAAAIAAIASAGALTACGSAASSAGAAAGPPAGPAAGGSATPLSTSLSTVKDSWVIVPVSANPAFWQVLVRPTAAATWRLVTPPGVADNGGLVAADSGSSLTVAVRPSQALLFSPLASTADAGATWTAPAPLSASVAASPGALAAAGSRLLAVLGDGAIVASANAGASWQTLAQPGAVTVASSPAGVPCGTVRVSSVSFGLGGDEALAAGSCGATRTTSLFSHSLRTASGGWQRFSLPVSGPLLRLFNDGSMLVQARTGLIALLSGTSGWYAYAPLSSSAKLPVPAWTASAPLPVTGPLIASGELAGPVPAARHGAAVARDGVPAAGDGAAVARDGVPAAGDGAWVLLPGGRAAMISGPGQPWVLLPPAPARTSVLAAGPGGAVDALAVAGAQITVWRLVRAATIWRKIQSITVPVQFGSSN